MTPHDKRTVEILVGRRVTPVYSQGIVGVPVYNFPIDSRMNQLYWLHDELPGLLAIETRYWFEQSSERFEALVLQILQRA